MRENTHSFSCARASWPIFSRSWLLRRGLMARASSASKTSSPSFSSTRGCSRGTMMVPLDFLVPILGRVRASLGVRVGSSPFTDEADEPGVAVDGLGLGSRVSDAAAVVLAVLVAVGAGDGAVEGGSVDELTVAGVAAAEEAVGRVEGGDDILGVSVVVGERGRVEMK